MQKVTEQTRPQNSVLSAICTVHFFVLQASSGICGTERHYKVEENEHLKMTEWEKCYVQYNDSKNEVMPSRGSNPYFFLLNFVYCTRKF